MKDQWNKQIETFDDLLSDAWYYVEEGLLNAIWSDDGDLEWTLTAKGARVLAGGE